MKTVWITLLIAMALPSFAEEAEWSYPKQGTEFTFPRDHGSHPDFKIEWWYITGHMMTHHRRYGFQATFFRLGQKPGEVDESDEFGGSQIYMAHMGLSDPQTGRFLHEERLNREGWNAGASVEDLDLFNGNWSLKRKGSGIVLNGTIRSDAGFSLTLLPTKPLVRFGETGVSKKGKGEKAASYYLTYPRMELDGELTLNGETLRVAGQAWMDHEISSSQLERGQIGWDWTCIQFEDGREIMGYILRTESGEPSPFSRLVWIDEKGKLTHQTPEEYSWKQDGEWTSPNTGATYPVKPVIETTDPKSGKKRTFQLIPIMEAQEMTGGAGGVSYWEGACDVIDLSLGEVVGKAYLEMTGYADNIADKLR